MDPEDLETRSRLALSSALGDAIREALDDPAVVEVLVNSDGRIWIDTITSGRTFSGAILQPPEAERLVRLLAHCDQKIIGRKDPRISGVLPGSGHRFQASVAPISANPVVAIRKKAGRVFGLEHYAAQGSLSEMQKRTIEEALEARLNLVIAGGAGSGKTTFANALLAHPAAVRDRIILLEDTPELNCCAPDSVRLVTCSDPRVTLGDLVRDSLRLRPDRIVVGEVRDGGALELLKAWNTGHPGGIATLHANSAADVLLRLEELASEASLTPPRALIGRSVDLIVFMRRTPTGRQVDELLRVDAFEAGSYRTRPGELPV